MSDGIDRPCTAAWLLFCQRPTDRALDGWNPMPGLDIIAREGEEEFVRFISGELFAY